MTGTREGKEAGGVGREAEGGTWIDSGWLALGDLCEGKELAPSLTTSDTFDVEVLARAQATSGSS